MPVWRVLPLADGDDPKKGVRVIRQAWNREPFLSGVVIDVGVTSGTSEFTIHHRLGRVPKGFVVEWMERTAGATNSVAIYFREGSTRTKDDLTLFASSSFAAARIRVF